MLVIVFNIYLSDMCSELTKFDCVCGCVSVCVCVCVCVCDCDCDWDWVCICVCVCCCSLIVLTVMLIENVYLVCFIVVYLWNEWDNAVCGPDGWKAVCGPHGLR